MSEHEGFGGSMLEAMYVGVPVLAFDATAVPHVVGDAAVLVERKEHAVAAEALALLVADDSPLRRRMIAKGRQHVVQFQPELVSDQMVAAVARALDLDRPTRGLAERLEDGYTNVLSVSRLAPNKCHEDTIKLFYHYKRQINPRSRLILCGAPTVPAYRIWLERLVKRLGLDPHVLFPGHAPNEDVAAYYRAADAFVSMSEHEGFGASLLASMYVGVPVLAFASTAVPDVVGDAAVLVERKEHAVAAEALALLVDRRSPLRARMVEKGHARVELFAPERVRDQIARFRTALSGLEGWTQERGR
jgi:glycosyltransferase involved in cell wall biosynthesis